LSGRVVASRALLFFELSNLRPHISEAESNHNTRIFSLLL
jgi:hypothetical protein